ncbi:conserved hypothetical protein [Ricinus communis]|uniref:Uncharacterized protein n=1 Tax=Ricinus communis TaxID=3988 RepID=B9RBJ6_RICCO|nr:conserved hypothetical protein [Ricinus communis]
MCWSTVKGSRGRHLTDKEYPSGIWNVRPFPSYQTGDEMTSLRKTQAVGGSRFFT